MALFGRAALALDKSYPAAAADLIDRFLRRISPDDRAERVFAIEMLVRAQIALREYDQIPALLAEAQSL